MVKNQYLCDCNIIHREAVRDALAAMPSRATLQKLALIYKLLGNETRYQICFALNERELCVCDLANVLSMTKSSISHQLKILRDNHLVKARQAGTEVYCRLDDSHIQQILQLGIEHIKHLKEDSYGKN